MNTLPRLRAQRGFTLIELVAAFTIFALGFGILLQILGGGLHTTRQASEYTQAALWAQSMLDIQGIGEPLKEGSSSGRFDDTYSWQLNISHYDPPPVNGAANGPVIDPSHAGLGGGLTPGQMQLMQLELVVSWGGRYLTHHARFVTLRAFNPSQPGINSGRGLPGFGG